MVKLVDFIKTIYYNINVNIFKELKGMRKNETEQIIKNLKDQFNSLKEEYHKFAENYSNLADLKEAIHQHDKNIIKDVLFDILTDLYFAEFTIPDNYDNMTKEDLIDAYKKIGQDIEKRYNYDYDKDFMQL